MEKLAILDSGGQYTKVIDRKVRELLVESHIFPLHTAAAELAGYGGIILSGGPESVYEPGSPLPDPAIYGLGVPVLGICYGMQAMVQQLGGTVSPHVAKEYGEALIDIDPSCALFHSLGAQQRVLMSHGDSVERMAGGFRVVGRSGEVVAAVADEQRRLYGVQFHPEVDLTEHGLAMLDNFLRRICGFVERYELEDRIALAVRKIREQVSDGQVIALVSGGVDSAVTAALLAKALRPEQIHAIHVDHGLMRKGESDVIEHKLGGPGFVRINAADDFLGALASVTDPEEKRAIIGQLFIDVVQRETAKLHLDFDKAFLAQGTLRPDLIESGNPLVSGYAHKIKTHHNDVDVIRAAREKGRVVETNWDWHKDEVRQVARLLGLGEDIAARQPFPGPGLAVRVIASDGSGTVDPALQSALEAALPVGYAGRVMPIRSVGVQGDHRTYGALALIEGNPADCLGIDEAPPLAHSKGFAQDRVSHAKGKGPRPLELARELTAALPGINRVALLLRSTLPLGSIALHPLHIRPDTVALLREADALVTSMLPRKGIDQCFAVLLPLGGQGPDQTLASQYGVAVRTFVTSDFMTGRPAYIGSEVPPDVLLGLADALIERLGLSFVCYDVTGKPPATVEWE